MEYHVPVDQGIACLDEVLHALRKHQSRHLFPLEFRFVKEVMIFGSVLLSAGFDFISVHQYHKRIH